jgi:pyruvate dehydrogenase E2 component (dihydrolipoamide acetyltransferase)
VAALEKFKMPAMSPTMTEGGIASWKKKEGEAFSAGDVLLEIETDKATIDVEAQDDGVLAKIIKDDGSKGIAVGSTIAIIAEEGDDLSGADKLASEGDDAAPAVPKEDEPAPKKEEPKKEEAPKKEEKPAAKGDAQVSQGTPVKSPVGADKPSFFATPVARKIALEKGIPLGQVKGSGPGGLIQKVSHPRAARA